MQTDAICSQTPLEVDVDKGGRRMRYTLVHQVVRDIVSLTQSISAKLPTSSMPCPRKGPFQQMEHL